MRCSRATVVHDERAQPTCRDYGRWKAQAEKVVQADRQDRRRRLCSPSLIRKT
jgi:hypothetical protein